MNQTMNAHNLVLLIWLVIVSAAVWVGLDARIHRIASTDRTYRIYNGALVASLSGILVFFGAQFLLGIWFASAAWTALFASYIVRRSKVLATRTEPIRLAVPSRSLPPLPVIPREEPPATQETQAEVEVAQVKAKVVLVKGACEHCRGHLQFSSEAMGQVIECPHCKGRTKLTQDRLLTATPSQKKAKSLPVGILVGAQTSRSSGPGGNQPDVGSKPG